MMESPVFFLIASTAIAVISIRINSFITKVKLRSDHAFWFTWVFLIWSAETVTSLPYFDDYYRYTIEPETRAITLLTFVASAVGFFIGSVLYSQARGVAGNAISDARIAIFAKRWQGSVSPIIFAVGLIEFTQNLSSFSNLLDLRLAAVEGNLQTATFYTQFFLFSQAFIMLIGFSDGFNVKVSRRVVALIVGGLVLHNLSVGGRINIIVAPALYLIPFFLMVNQREHLTPGIKHRIRRFVIILASSVIILFSAVKVFRSYVVDTSSVSSFDGLLMNVLFAIPMYVSDTFISISVHTSHARVSEMPFGYFTFDAVYRFFSYFFPLQLQDPNTVFGHAYYRDTSDVWAWTQTNLIPRLVSDFGSFFWLALVPISALVQWLSIYRMRISFVGVVLRSLMVFSSAYTILAAAWFTSLNVYILFYAFLLYLLAVRGPFNYRHGSVRPR